MWNSNNAGNYGNATFNLVGSTAINCPSSTYTPNQFIWVLPTKTIDDEIREALGELRKAITDFRAEYLDKPKKKSSSKHKYSGKDQVKF